MGGANNAHINLGFVRIADTAHRFFLNRTQKLHLHGQRQIRHFIQKKRATVGMLEKAQPVGIGAGEAAFFIAEKFALHQVFGNGSAVYRDKGTACAL